MFRIKITNCNDSPIVVQVDPWAGLYQLHKGEAIEIAAQSKSENPVFDMDEHGNSRIVTLMNCDEYFVVRNNEHVHWSKFPTNIVE